MSNLKEGDKVFKRFETSNYAEEGSFIGRRTMLNRLGRELCVDADVRVSYCGLLKIGKTSLVRRFEEQINHSCVERNGYRCIVVYFTLYTLDAAENSLFKCLTEMISKALSKQRVTISEESIILKQKVLGAEKSSDQARQMSEYVASLYANGIRIILILDELQSAPEKQGLVFTDFALLHGMRHISIAYVGRLPFDKTMNDLSPSAWNSRLACKQRVILGFNEEDMQEYCSVFYELYGYDITWMLEKLDYYCGRSPFLLACFGEEILYKLEDEGAIAIDHDWLDKIYKSLRPGMYEDDVENQLSLDTYRNMNNLERLLRIVIGPQIGIQEWDIAMMKELGYITVTDRATYAISPRFMKRLEKMPISGELPTKLVTAETYLRRLIHMKLPEICQANPFSEPIETRCGKKKHLWTEAERTILNLELKKIPDNVPEKRKLDGVYKLYDSMRTDRKDSPDEKYALWIENKKETMPNANIEEVMLLKDRLALINGCWRFFKEYFDNGDRDYWKVRFYLMCVARNPALHAGTLTEQEQIECERVCDDIIRLLGKLSFSEND